MEPALGTVLHYHTLHMNFKAFFSLKLNFLNIKPTILKQLLSITFS